MLTAISAWTNIDSAGSAVHSRGHGEPLNFIRGELDIGATSGLILTCTLHRDCLNNVDNSSMRR
jgi:hypothetical protein